MEKCPRQTAFVEQLDDLLSSYFESMKDRSSVDEQDKYIEKFVDNKKRFVNLWCPTLKEYDEY